MASESQAAEKKAIDPRYPIGRFEQPAEITTEALQGYISTIRDLPTRMASCVQNFKPEYFDIPYREGGWTVRQLIHHVADSHMNAYVRMKLALTEDSPSIKSYNQTAWAELPDSHTLPASVSLGLLSALHARWAALLDSLKPEQFERTIQHPEMGTVSIAKLASLYHWHSRHHLAHITELSHRSGW